MMAQTMHKFIDPPDVSFTEFFIEVIREYGENIALIDPQTSKEYKFSDIKNEVDTYFTALQKLGVQKGEVIGLFSGNSSEFLFLCLASWKLGAIVCPLNPAYKKGEFEKYFNEVQISWLFTEDEYVEKLENCGILAKNKICVINEFLRNSIKFNGKVENNAEGVKGDDSASIFYSSGTTGPPKGVVLTHASLSGHLSIIKSLRHSSEFLILAPKDTVFGVLPYFHAGGLLTTFIILAQGARVVINRRFTEDDFLKTIEKYQVTILNVVPPILEFLAYSPKILDYKLNSLKYIYVGAAKVKTEVLKAVESRLRNLGDTRLDKVIQLYGLTEAGITVLMTPITELAESKEGTCGVALPGVDYKIVYSESQQDIAPGDTGELLLRTKTMMKGYFNDPEKTSHAFTFDGWLKTGDLVHKDSDDFFYIVGRVKELLKVRGWQVSPYELEEALAKSFSGIKEVVVIGIQDESGGDLPTAVIVLHENRSIEVEEVENYVKDHFVSYKQLKGGVYFVEDLPKTASGKINRPEVVKKIIKIR